MAGFGVARLDQIDEIGPEDPRRGIPTQPGISGFPYPETGATERSFDA
jgi:hypothetical protein